MNLCPGTLVLSECTRRMNTSAAFAQQDKGSQFLLGKRLFFTTVLSLVSCRLTSARVARRADFSLASHTPCSAEAFTTTELRSTSGSPASSCTKSSSPIGACEERVCERIRHGLASHSPWFWCSCSRYRSGSTMLSLKATQVLTAR